MEHYVMECKAKSTSWGDCNLWKNNEVEFFDLTGYPPTRVGQCAASGAQWSAQQRSPRLRLVRAAGRLTWVYTCLSPRCILTMAPPGTPKSGRAAAVVHYIPSHVLIQTQKHRLLRSLQTHMPAKRQKQACPLLGCGERGPFCMDLSVLSIREHGRRCAAFQADCTRYRV